MFDFEILLIAVRNLMQQPLRSFLTLLGVVIGIGAIVALVTLGQGLNQAVAEQFELMGTNNIFVISGTSGFMGWGISQTIKEADVATIERVPGVEAAIPLYETSATVRYGNETAGVLLIGIEAEDLPYFGKTGFVDITEGRELTAADTYALVVPHSFVEDAFSSELKLRQRVQIKGKAFKIVGITAPSDIMFSNVGMANFVWAPAATVKSLFAIPNPVEIVAIAAERSLVDEVAARIEDALEEAHREKDFSVMTSESMLATAGAVMILVQLVLLGIAAISLVVGGIGIMNTMLMIVMERTREIGIMKAIGATNSRILAMFLLEAGFIGLIGGVLGIALGLGAAFGVSVAAVSFGFPISFAADPSVIAGALSFSVLVGVVSGIVPARRAALLEPGVSLRYE